MRWEQIRLQRYGQEQELLGKIKRRVSGQVILPCSCCKGRGKLGTSPCHICHGKGEVALVEPIRRCAFCRGSGRGKVGTTITCSICKGRGAISVVEPVHDCPQCQGSGRGGKGLPCVKCGGKGVVMGPEPEGPEGIEESEGREEAPSDERETD